MVDETAPEPATEPMRCTACGQQLGAGRFCAHCGTPIGGRTPATSDEGDWRTDTAERARPVRTRDPRTPPSVSAPPLPQRYPLFADEVEGWTPDGALVTRAGLAPEPEPEPAPAPDSAIATWFDDEPPAYDDVRRDERDSWDDERGDRRSPWLWILVALLVVAAIAAAWWFVVRPDVGRSGAPTSGRDTPTGSDEASASAPQGATASNVAGEATATAPRTAPDSRDVDGNRTSFAASNLVDGDVETAWRAPGDVSGLRIRLQLAEPTTISEVGLVNGYAKTSGGVDWYAGNRRVSEVVWLFPDGTKVRQTLVDSREPQLIDLGPVTADSVVLRITGVTAPGEGRSGRDFTAISEIAVLGTPAG